MTLDTEMIFYYLHFSCNDENLILLLWRAFASSTLNFLLTIIKKMTLEETEKVITFSRVSSSRKMFRNFIFKKLSIIIILIAIDRKLILLNRLL